MKTAFEVRYRAEAACEIIEAISQKIANLNKDSDDYKSQMIEYQNSGDDYMAKTYNNYMFSCVTQAAFLEEIVSLITKAI